MALRGQGSLQLLLGKSVSSTKKRKADKDDSKEPSVDGASKRFRSSGSGTAIKPFGKSVAERPPAAPPRPRQQLRSAVLPGSGPLPTPLQQQPLAVAKGFPLPPHGVGWTRIEAAVVGLRFRRSSSGAAAAAAAAATVTAAVEATATGQGASGGCVSACQLPRGLRYRLAPEPMNPQDPNAVQVLLCTQPAAREGAGHDNNALPGPAAATGAGAASLQAAAAPAAAPLTAVDFAAGVSGPCPCPGSLVGYLPAAVSRHLAPLLRMQRIETEVHVDWSARVAAGSVPVLVYARPWQRVTANLIAVQPAAAAAAAGGAIAGRCSGSAPVDGTISTRLDGRGSGDCCSAEDDTGSGACGRAGGGGCDACGFDDGGAAGCGGCHSTIAGGAGVALPDSTATSAVRAPDTTAAAAAPAPAPTAGAPTETLEGGDGVAAAVLEPQEELTEEAEVAAGLAAAAAAADAWRQSPRAAAGSIAPGEVLRANFALMVEDVRRHDAHLLSPAEHDLLDSLTALPPPPQCLFLRLLLRRGPWFQLAAITYPECGGADAAAAAEALVAAGLANWPQPEDWPQVAELLLVAEVRSLVSEVQRQQPPPPPSRASILAYTRKREPQAASTAAVAYQSARPAPVSQPALEGGVSAGGTGGGGGGAAAASSTPMQPLPTAAAPSVLAGGGASGLSYSGGVGRASGSGTSAVVGPRSGRRASGGGGSTVGRRSGGGDAGSGGRSGHLVGGGYGTKAAAIEALRQLGQSCVSEISGRVAALAGRCVRLSPSSLELVARLQRLYFLAEGPAADLGRFLATERGVIRYPTYTIRRSTSAFASRQQLLQYEEALRHAAQLEASLERGDDEGAAAALAPALAAVRAGAHQEVRWCGDATIPVRAVPGPWVWEEEAAAPTVAVGGRRQAKVKVEEGEGLEEVEEAAEAPGAVATGRLGAAGWGSRQAGGGGGHLRTPQTAVGVGGGSGSGPVACGGGCGLGNGVGSGVPARRRVVESVDLTLTDSSNGDSSSSDGGSSSSSRSGYESEGAAMQQEPREATAGAAVAPGRKVGAEAPGRQVGTEAGGICTAGPARGCEGGSGRGAGFALEPGGPSAGPGGGPGPRAAPRAEGGSATAGNRSKLTRVETGAGAEAEVEAGAAAGGAMEDGVGMEAGEQADDGTCCGGGEDDVMYGDEYDMVYGGTDWEHGTDASILGGGGEGPALAAMQRAATDAQDVVAKCNRLPQDRMLWQACAHGVQQQQQQQASEQEQEQEQEKEGEQQGERKRVQVKELGRAPDPPPQDEARAVVRHAGTQESQPAQFLARFSAAWVYASMGTVGVSLLERQRRYGEAVALLRQLLAGRCCPGRRGDWWLRMSVDLQHLGREEEALQVAEAALSDPWVRHGDRLALQRRVLRLGKPPRRWRRPAWAAAALAEPREVVMSATMLRGTTGLKSRFIAPTTAATTTTTAAAAITTADAADAPGAISARAVPQPHPASLDAAAPAPSASSGFPPLPPPPALGPASGPVLGAGSGSGSGPGSDPLLVSVEELALLHYGSPAGGGWRGVHSEGGVWVTLWALLLWDVLFMDVPEVFRSPFQTAPLDLDTDAFLPARREAVDRRLQAIAAGGAAELLRAKWASQYGTWCRGVNWERLPLEDLVDIARCVGGLGLSVVCRLLCEDAGGWRGGMPDLLLWRPHRGDAMVSEVKGPRDRLSDQQRAWLAALAAAEVRAEVLRVVEAAAPTNPPSRPSGATAAAAAAEGGGSEPAAAAARGSGGGGGHGGRRGRPARGRRAAAVPVAGGGGGRGGEGGQKTRGQAGGGGAAGVQEGVLGGSDVVVISDDGDGDGDGGGA